MAEAVAGIVEVAVIVLEHVNVELKIFPSCRDGLRGRRDHGCQKVRRTGGSARAG